MMKTAKLKGLLAERGMTQQELAKSIGLSTKSVNAKINGKVDITVAEAVAISKVLEIKNPGAIFFD